MSTSTPTTPQDALTLSHLRTHLTTLTSTLTNTLHLLSAPNPPGAPLPHYPHLTTSLNYASYHLQQLASTIAANPALMRGGAVYPLPSFGLIGGAQGERRGEAVLSQLLRKRLGDGVEGWILEAGRVGRGGTEGEGMSMAERRELWGFAGERAGEETEGIPRGWDYSVEEVVNGAGRVRTGVRRRLFAGGEDEESGEESGGEEGGKMDVDVKEGEGGAMGTTGEEQAPQTSIPPMALEDVLRFMTRGEIQRGPGVGMR